MYKLLPKVICRVHEAAEEPTLLDLCRFFCVAGPCVYMSNLSRVDANGIQCVEKTTLQIALSPHILKRARVFLRFHLTKMALWWSLFVHLSK